MTVNGDELRTGEDVIRFALGDNHGDNILGSPERGSSLAKCATTNISRSSKGRSK